jgi:hypothetical protein
VQKLESTLEPAGFSHAEFQIGEETVCDICRNKKLCVQCNRLINKTSNSRKYCKECAKEIKRGQDRISDRIYKQKLKSEKCKNS